MDESKAGGDLFVQSSPGVLIFLSAMVGDVFWMEHRRVLCGIVCCAVTRRRRQLSLGTRGIATEQPNSESAMSPAIS